MSRILNNKVVENMTTYGLDNCLFQCSSVSLETGEKLGKLYMRL